MKQRVGLIVALLALAAGGCAVGSDTEQNGLNEEAPGSAASEIINGTVVVGNPNNVVGILIPGGSCSGTVLSNGWVVTARHCVVNGSYPQGVPANTVTVILKNKKTTTANCEPGEQCVVAAEVIQHPAYGIDVSLIRLATPLTINGSTSGYLRALYPGTTAALLNQTLSCEGWGNYTATDNNGELHQANIKVNSIESDGFRMVPNAQGQIQASGDSGGPCFLGQSLTSVQSSCYGTESCYAISISGIREWIDNNMWSGLEQFEPISAGIGMSSQGQGKLDLFARSASGTLLQKTLNGSWSGWTDLGGTGFIGDPAAVSWAPGRIDVFARSATNTLMHRWYTGSWSAWEDLGGTITSSPTAASWGAGRLDVFARGLTGDLRHIWFAGGWQAWEGLGGSIVDSPAAVAWGPGRLDVFARGTGNDLRHTWLDGTWKGWEGLGGVLNAGVAAASFRSGRLDVVVRGTGDWVYHKYFDNGGWSEGFMSMQLRIASDPELVSWGPGRLDLAARSYGGNALHMWFPR